MCSLNCLLITCLFSVLLIRVSTAQNHSKDAIGFPEMEENPDLKNKEDRKPVFLPSMCPTNELYYPGDQKDDWICDCRPAHIYHPASDACWPAYQRGPCPEGQYLILPPDSVLPVCEKNPCIIDTFVLWNGKCERLGSTGPCSNLFPNASALWVNATTLVVTCVKINLESRFGDPVPEQLTTPCPPGCKRSINGKCVPVTLL